MTDKLKFPIKINDNKVLYTIEDEKNFFKEREEKIRENTNYFSSSFESDDVMEYSAFYAYGIDII